MSPAILRDVLSRTPAMGAFGDLLVGAETSDDAAVWRLNDTQALVATTDFFMPMVDDPFDFGRIAAANALSDVYAMGGSPILALAIVGMPVAQLSTATIARVLEGGAAICAEAGVPIAGGHTIDSVEPIYGLVALGLVHPERILTNRTARAGDILILTKALGVGVLGAAYKKGVLDPAGYAALIASTTQLNTLGRDLGDETGVHAVTDVTGFGLLGHALEMARGSGLTAVIEEAALAWLPGVEAFGAAGVVTGASGRNWASYGAEVSFSGESRRRDLLCDPQTSGGLLIAVAPDRSDAVLRCAIDQGFVASSVIGRMEAGNGRVRVVSPDVQS
jgi:selenide,water dikinase